MTAMHALSGRRAKRARRQAPGRAPGRALAVPPGVIRATDAPLGMSHLMTHEAMAAGRRYAALCGREVRPAIPTTPRGLCPCCVAWFVAWRYRLVDPRSHHRIQRAQRGKAGPVSPAEPAECERT